ncbi:hypothetical protein EX30DRAFT_351558 [Ascodesmis nigricans]|uniref:Uncharacterized protein n=1 Tax=Ascodesmis nigricans TaxID=341454 RepID=A0A4S2ML28_9PEZI|nr:hypothetical protein EX30DRAFT_351558 [Ascodesmis nigricans]
MPPTSTFTPRIVESRRATSDISRDRDHDRDRDRDWDRDERRYDSHRDRERDKRRESDRGDIRRDSAGRSTVASSVRTGSIMSSPAIPSAALPFPDDGDQSVTGYPAMEASLAYIRYQDALKQLTKAQEDRQKHVVHFKVFPAMADRYEGDLTTAKTERDNAEKTWKEKKAVYDKFMTDMIRAETSKAVGNPKTVEQMTNIVKALVLQENAKQKPAPTLDPLVASQIAELREELASIKKQNEKKDEIINHLTKNVTELRNFLEKLDPEGLKKDVMEAQELALSISDTHNKGMTKRFKDTETRVQGLLDRVEMYHSEVTSLGKLKEEILHEQTQSLGALKIEIMNEQIDAINKLVLEKIEARGNPPSHPNENEPPAQNPSSSEHFATIEDIAEAQRHIFELFEETRKIEDHEKLLDDLKKMLEEMRNNPGDAVVSGVSTQSTPGVPQTTNQIGELDQKIKLISDSCVANRNDIVRVEAEMRNKFQQVTAFLHKEIPNFQTGLSNITQNFTPRINAIDVGFAEIKKTTETLQFALGQLSQRMDDWSSKDFYEHLVIQLASQNPNFFDTGRRLDTLFCTSQSHSIELRKLSNMRADLYRRLEACEAVVTSAQPATNGTGPATTPAVILKTEEDVKKLTTELSALKENIGALPLPKLGQAVDDLRGQYEQIRSEMKEWMLAAEKLTEIKQGLKNKNPASVTVSRDSTPHDSGPGIAGGAGKGPSNSAEGPGSGAVIKPGDESREPAAPGGP